MSQRLLDGIPREGIYTLVIRLLADARLRIGKLGERWFAKSYYTYTGSALGKGASNLRGRVARHLRRDKPKFWHVDYLLTCKEAVVTAVIACWTDKKLECKINRYLKNKLAGKTPVSNFGASDCKENCGSHLLYFGERDIKHEAALIYRETLGCKVVVADLTKI